MERAPSESPDEYLERLQRGARRRRRIFLAVVTAAILASSVAYAPGWCIERAANSYAACSNRDYEDRPQLDTSCDSTAWLILPKLVPWKRKAALDEEISIQRSVASRRFKQATSFQPDRAARARAADELAAVYRKERDNASSPASEGLVSILALEGDAEAVRRHSEVANTPSGVNNVMRALFAIADLDAAIAFAKAPPALVKEEYASRDMFLARGALLCLGGDSEAGGRALREAERVHAGFHTFPYYEARIARAACGESVVGERDDLDREPLLTFAIGTRLKGKALDARLIEEWHDHFTISRQAASPFVAAALAERERSLDDSIALVSAVERIPFLGMAPVPWTSRGASVGLLSGEPILLDPERHERAAERLEGLLATALEEESDDKAIEARVAKLPIHTSDRYRTYRAKPKEVLGHFARGFWLEAAAARSGLGDAAHAERDIERARTLGNEGETVVFAAPILMSIGRFARANELLERVSNQPGIDNTTRALLDALHAETLAHDRKWKAALEKAQNALQRAEKLESHVGEPLAMSIRWLVLALAFETNDLSAAPPVRTPEIYEKEPMSWTDLVAMPDPDRATARWRMRGVDIGGLPIALPAQMFVIGQAARGLDIEVWLDQQLGVFDRRLTGAPALRARAEAARLRGDDGAEAEWIGRAESLEKRFSDPRRRVLGSLLGL